MAAVGHSVQYTIYSVQCAVYSVQYILLVCSVQCVVYEVALRSKQSGGKNKSNIQQKLKTTINWVGYFSVLCEYVHANI